MRIGEGVTKEEQEHREVRRKGERLLCRLDITKLKTSGVKLMLPYSVIHLSCCCSSTEINESWASAGI